MFLKAIILSLFTPLAAEVDLFGSKIGGIFTLRLTQGLANGMAHPGLISKGNIYHNYFYKLRQPSGKNGRLQWSGQGWLVLRSLGSILA